MTDSSWRRAVGTDANVGFVEDPVQFQENQPRTHKCVFDQAGGSYFEHLTCAKYAEISTGFVETVRE